MSSGIGRQRPVTRTYQTFHSLHKGQGKDRERAIYQFRNSRWFRTGWKLEELLAPGKLIFSSRNWVALGTRTDLWDLVRMKTGIRGQVRWEEASVAQKMSWASKRGTNRSEDRACSLMGFGVKM
jgi:hypothetical protein